MPIIILGLLVVVGLIAYLYATRDEVEEIKAETVVEKAVPKEEGPAKVIDLEKEMKKRNIKTGK